MSMTELEIARMTRRLIETSPGRAIYTRTEFQELLNLCRDRENELEAAELEAREPKDPAALVERVALLEKAMKEHRHYPSLSTEACMLSRLSSVAVDYELCPPMPAGF